MTFLSELETYKKDQEGELSYWCPMASYEKAVWQLYFAIGEIYSLAQLMKS